MRLLLLWLAPLLAAAQSMSVTGAMEGTVVDSSSAPMPAVTVTARHAGSGASRTAGTDELGRFRLTGLPIGDYSLRLEREGFASVFLERFTVSIGQTVVHRFEMRPAQVSERLDVKEQPEALETTATATGVALGGDRIEESPAQNRNYLNFVLVAPGVATSSGSNAQRAAAGVKSAGADSGFSFGGMRGRNNGLSIDGVDNRDETTGGSRVAIGLEMVQEFRVSGAVVPAEFGGAAGGVVNVVTRSGSNIWHGDATFFTQNEFANARNPEAQVGRKPLFRRYQPGASVNGPARRDRTFFSTAFEQEWESGEEWSEVPAAYRDAILRALARPEFSRAATRAPSRDLFPVASGGTEFSFKANHQVNLAHALSGRYAFSRGRVDNEVHGIDNFAERSARAGSLTRDQSLVAEWLAVPRPHIVNDARVQVSRHAVDLTPNSRGAMLEIPGVVTFGQAYTLDSSRTEDHYQVVESLSLATGRHQLGVGASLHSVHLDARLANRFGGLYVFPTLEAFQAGRPDVFLQAFGDPHTRYSTLPAGAWLQDRWQPVTGLTLDLGLRWDRQSLPAGIPGASANWSPRFGVAWRPGVRAPYVLRAGIGWFYDRYPLAFLNDAIQKDGSRAFEQYQAGEGAARAFAIGQGGTLPQPIDGVSRSTYRAASHFPTTFSRKITAGIERSLGPHTTVNAEWIWVRGFHLPRVRNASLSLPPQYLLEQTSRSAFRGGTISVNRRMTKEVTYLVTYSLGRTLDDASDYDEQPFHPADLRAEWARSRQHQAHRLVASGLFELPAEDLPKAIRKPLDHITIAPIFTAGSGRPIRALDSTDALRTGAYPISARPFGLGRNPFLSPAALSLDLRVMKGFWLKPDRAVLLFAVESFNLLNHSNPLRVSPYYAAGGQRLTSYRGTVETLYARQVQFSLSLEY
ncbi:MAG: TonB-dependent receptor [Acidobacteria bacterium]|nr:TonB-dependent receptor [Acidobacteriota bacterium]